MAQGLVQPPDSKDKYNGQPIPPEYALVHMAWVAEEHEKDELDYPLEDGNTTIRHALGLRVVWNKADIVLMEKPASKPAQPSPSPPGSPSDDDNAGGSGSSPRRSTPPDKSDPQGDIGGAPGNDTPPPSGPKGTEQCPAAPKKHTVEDEGKPPHLTTEQWAAYQIAEDFTYTIAFDRYTSTNLTICGCL